MNNKSVQELRAGDMAMIVAGFSRSGAKIVRKVTIKNSDGTEVSCIASPEALVSVKAGVAGTKVVIEDQN